MRFLLCLVLVLGVAIATPSLAQDVWNYVTHPVLEQVEFPGTFTTIAQATAYAQSRIPSELRQQMDDYLPIVAVKIALLAEFPSTNAATQALLSRAVPTGTSSTNEIRYMAAFKREVQIGYGSLAGQVAARVPSAWARHERYSDQYDNMARSPVSTLMSTAYRRAAQIVATMERLESQQMAGLAAQVEFIRDSALVSLGQQTGFRLSAAQQNLYVKVHAADSQQLVAPLRFVDCRELYHIGRGTASTATAHIVGKNGPVLVKVGTAAGTVSLKDTLRTLTDAELALGVQVTPIDVPVVDGHIANQTVESTTEQTVSYAGTFDGTRLTYQVTSSQPSVATARLGEAGILVIRGVSAGNSTITLTASNEAGNAVTTFIATVTARESD